MIDKTTGYAGGLLLEFGNGDLVFKEPHILFYFADKFLYGFFQWEGNVFHEHYR